jgi:hypothetical protein
MSKKNIVNILQDKFESHEMEVNTTELWNSVAPAIAPKKNRRALIIFFFVLGVGLLALGVPKGSLKEQTVHSKEIQVEKTADQGELVDSKSISEQNTSAVLQENNIQNSRLSTQNIAGNIDKKLKNQLDSANDQDLQGILNVKAEQKQNPIVNQQIVSEQSKPSDWLKANALSTTKEDEDVSPDDEFGLNAEKNSSTSSLIEPLLTLEMLPVLNYSAVGLSPTFQYQNKVHIDKKRDVQSANWMFGVTAGIGKPTMFLKPKEAKFETLADQRKSIERGLESILLKAGLTYQMKNGLSFALNGLYEEYHYASTHEVNYQMDQQYEDVVIEIIQQQNGQQTQMKGDALGSKEIAVSGTRYHTYRSFSGQLELGYLIKLGKNGLHTKLGCSYPIFQQMSGLQFDQANLPEYDLSKDLDSRFVRPLKAHATIQYEYRLANKNLLVFGVFASLEDNMTDISYGLNQQQLNGGVHVAYQFQLKN